MVLQTLDTLGALHGYAIAARLEQVSGGSLQLNMGTLCSPKKTRGNGVDHLRTRPAACGCRQAACRRR